MSSIIESYPLSVLALARIHLEKGHIEQAVEILGGYIDECKASGDSPNMDCATAYNALDKMPGPLGKERALVVIGRVLG